MQSLAIAECYHRVIVGVPVCWYSQWHLEPFTNPAKVKIVDEPSCRGLDTNETNLERLHVSRSKEVCR